MYVKVLPLYVLLVEGEIYSGHYYDRLTLRLLMSYIYIYMS